MEAPSFLPNGIVKRVTDALSCKQLHVPDQIHAQQSLVFISALSAPHRLIPNAHLMLICSHLGPPQPGRSAQHHCISVGDLLDLYVRTLVHKREQDTQKLLIDI